jgi:hypothetical protein
MSASPIDSIRAATVSLGPLSVGAVGLYWWSMVRAAARLVSIALSLTLMNSRAPAQTNGAKARRFFSARLGVGVEAPAGWSLSLHTGYANVLCTLLHPGGSRISLAVDRTTAKDATSLAAASRPGFVSQGLEVVRTLPGPRDGVIVEAHSSHREQAVRQLYLVRTIEGSRDERQAIVVTLTTPLRDMAAASSAFDWTIAHIILEGAARPDEIPDSKPDGGH